MLQKCTSGKIVYSVDLTIPHVPPRCPDNSRTLQRGSLSFTDCGCKVGYINVANVTVGLLARWETPLEAGGLMCNRYMSLVGNVKTEFGFSHLLFRVRNTQSSEEFGTSIEGSMLGSTINNCILLLFALQLFTSCIRHTSLLPCEIADCIETY